MFHNLTEVNVNSTPWSPIPIDITSVRCHKGINQLRYYLNTRIAQGIRRSLLNVAIAFCTKIYSEKKMHCFRMYIM